MGVFSELCLVEDSEEFLEAGEQRWTDAVQAAAAQLGLAFHDRSSLERASEVKKLLDPNA